MLKWISNIAAIIWFFAVLIWWLLLLPIFILMIPSAMDTIIKSGFETSRVGGMGVFFCSLVFAITLLVPAFRKCFKVMPWLYPYTTILLTDLIILSIAEELLNFGYQVQNDTRHTVFIVLMIIQIIVCRLAMGWYFYKKPMKFEREDYERQ